MQILRNQISPTLPMHLVGVRKGYKFLRFGCEKGMNYMYTLEDCSADVIFLELRFHRTGDAMDVEELSDFKYLGSFNECSTKEMIHVYMKERL